MIVENLEELKKVRKDIKPLGYNIKSYTNSLGRFAEVFYKDEKLFILANKEHFIKHKIIYDYFNKYKNNKNNIVIKEVL